MKQGSTILALTVACLCLAQSLTADTLKGRVVDADTGEPLQGAKVVFAEESIGHGGTEVSSVYADSLGRFQYTCHMELSRLAITASSFGYHSQTVRRTGNNDRDTIVLDDFRLRMDEHLLGEVTVEGRTRRFYMRGDTVVFNPAAFTTHDGARLLELIEQLPGVSIKDGKLLWNGEPLRLMMNGQQAFSEAMLANVLPVEAVKDIKAYDRRSEFAERTGVGDGQEEHVLDVSIKPGFMDHLYGDAEAKGMTSKNYAAHLRAMRLSDTDPLMLYGRVADDPKAMSVVTIDRTGSWQGDEPVRQQTGAVGYGHHWKPAYKVWQESGWSISGGINHTDIAHGSWENLQTFMPGSSATETDQTSDDYQHQLKIPVDFGSFLNLNPNTMMRLTAYLAYLEKRNTEEKSGKSYDLGETQRTTNASDYHALSDEKGVSSKFKAEVFGFAGKAEYLAAAGIGYDHTKNDGASTGIYHYFNVPSVATVSQPTTHTDRQHFHAPTHQLQADMQLKARRAFGQSLTLLAAWQTVYTSSFRDEQRHRADTLDLANSLRRKDNAWRNSLSAEANLTLGKFSAKPMLDLIHWHEQSDYRRGRLDTLARRDQLLAMPTLELTYKWQKQTLLSGRIAYTSSRPDLIDCISYRDDTNPLYVTLGNPGLKTSRRLDASLGFRTMLSKASQVMSIALDFHRDSNPVGILLHYDSRTGAYQAQKQNVRGGERWGASLFYERDIGGGFHASNNLSGSYGQAYGIMTLVDDATGITYHRQRSSDFADRLNLEYNNGGLNVRLGQNFAWHRYTYSQAAQPRQDICNYRAELTARYKLTAWTFSLLPTFQLDRGYIADVMNADRFLLNASIAYRFLKNKASLILYANDLFNRDTRSHSNVTATTRTEGGTTFLHHYLSLSFSYKFDAKK